MNQRKLLIEFRRSALFLLLSLIGFTQLYGQSQTNERAQWFVDARYGMFIHWGLYSATEGIWKGEPLRNANNYAEWIYYRNRIEKDEYLELMDRFDWESIDPEEWVLLAKQAGMKYVTLTAKHHDGFALWDSQVSDYDIAEYTQPKRDIVKELAEACQKHGLKLGLYYSHWVDWEHPYGWDHTKEIYPITAEQYDQYWQEKVMPQMRELLSNYGPIGMIWFDMWINHSESIITKDQLLQLKSLIRNLQPDCLVNSRLGLSIEEDSDIDYRTLGDNQLGTQKLDYPWQSPGTVAHSWGFHQLDTEWKSTTSLLQALIGNVSLNGNYMLNIGPKANGKVPYEISQRLLEVGQWLEVNGESIYKAEAFDLPENQHDWGKITYKEIAHGIHRLYLHVYNWPYNSQLQLTGVTTQAQKAFVLSDKLQMPLKLKHQEVLTSIELPAEHPDNLISVIVLEYDQKPEIQENLVAKTVDGGFSLKAENCFAEEGQVSRFDYERGGTIPPHVLVEDTYQLRWKLFIDEPGNYRVDASYSFQGKKPAGQLKVQGADSSLEQPFAPTGLTVGEPNSDWHIPNFSSHDLGTLYFPRAGVYEISMQVEASKKLPAQFQWLWVRKVSRN